jgi:hypothetical protein
MWFVESWHQCGGGEVHPLITNADERSEPTQSRLILNLLYLYSVIFVLSSCFFQ